MRRSRRGRRLLAVGRALRPQLLARRRGALYAHRLTLAIGAVAGATTLAAIGPTLRRAWRRAPSPASTDGIELLQAAEEAVTETVEAAVAGYQEVSTRENAVFNLLASFVTSFLLARGIAALLRSRRTFGPFRDVRVGGRHVHHYVPGIGLSFASGTAAILSRDERAEPWLALAFGSGMGLTLDESALLLELDDVYWRPEGIVGVQITLAVAALMGSLTLALRFLRRGERAVEPGVNRDETAAGPSVVAAGTGP